MRSLANYEILGELGRGGMGIVYRARDTKLRREVAIKVLPEELQDDKDRLARFEREARVLATLNHPNIAAIYELAEADDVRFLVLELVEGEDLADRISRGPLSLGEALPLFVQLAEALEVAHDEGIVHRDLKPGNIKITPEGKVKVLDFGLAKSFESPDDVQDLSQSPTLTRNATATGVILGTASYMSPEQARGETVDPRTDVWAFGCVLYEALTGARAFSGKTVSDVIAAILKSDPDWSKLPRSTPEALRALTERCLRKDRDRRLRGIRDARVEIEESHDELSRGRKLDWPLAAGVAALAAVAIAVGSFLMRPDAPPVARNLLMVTSTAGVEDFPALSPDGEFLVYRKHPPDRGLYRKRVGGERTIRLTESGEMPAFSPDGSTIAYASSENSRGGVIVMGATGEDPKRLTDFGFNPSWSPEGAEIVFGTEPAVSATRGQVRSELWIVDVASGETRVLLEAADAVQPSWSPNGRLIAYWDIQHDNRDIWVVDASGERPLRLTTHPLVDWNPVWSDDGRYIYFLSNRAGSPSIWRLEVDAESGDPVGEPELFLPASGGVFRHISLSRDGKHIAYVVGKPNMNLFEVAFEPETESIGEPVAITEGSRPYWNPAVARDGSRLAIGVLPSEIAVMNTDGSGLRKLTDDVHRDFHADWAPDGNRIAFSSNRSGTYEIWTIGPDGSDLEQLTSYPDRIAIQPIWSPDGKRIAYLLQDSPSQIIEVDKPFEEQTPRSIPHADGEAGEFEPTSWSPDGRLLAGYAVRDPSGRHGIFVHDLGSGTTRRLTDFGRYPQWLRDNRRLLFLHDDEPGIRLLDTRTGDERRLLSVSGEIDGFTVPADNRAIYYVRSKVEADIWVAELSHP